MPKRRSKKKFVTYASYVELSLSVIHGAPGEVDRGAPPKDDFLNLRCLLGKPTRLEEEPFVSVPA